MSAFHSVELARFPRSGEFPVLGLIRGWGEVAVHGREGFRCQYATATCLFTDWFWGAEFQSDSVARLGSILRLWQLGGCKAGVASPPERAAAIGQVARRQGVPAVSLEHALAYGLLGELGLDDGRLHEVRAWLRILHGGVS